MLDINFIRKNPELVKKGVSAKGYDGQLVDKVLELDQKRRDLLQQVESWRGERNKAAEEKNIELGKKIKQQLQEKEPLLKQIEEEFEKILVLLPNPPMEDVPIGKGEDENKVLEIIGEHTKFDFDPKDHVQIGEALDIIDFQAGAKVSGSGFYYLKNEGAMLEIALVLYGMDFLRQKGFIPFITPDLVKEKYYLGTGYLPKGPEAQIYKIEDTDLGLIATAEITIAGYHAGQILNGDNLPLKYGGYSHCFRMEAGSYGKYSKGLYRVHQFTKVEMFAYTKPDESDKMHQEFLNNEKEFFQSLGIPFRVLQMCTGDLGSQAAKKYDLEAWMPGRGDYGEITSTSNTTDYQARNLGIKYKEGDKTEYVHTLNGTLCATSRAIIAILENFQQKDGSVLIPEVLRKYTGFSKVNPR